MAEIDNLFSERIKQLRSQKGETQAQFVEGIGITTSALSAYEKNLKNPSINVAKSIAEKYHVSVDWLCGLSENQNLDNEIRTYADLFQCIIKLSDINYLNGKWSPEYYDSYEHDQIPFGSYVSLQNEDPCVISFFKDWIQLFKLYKAGTIDKHLYNLWIKDKIAQYDGKKLPSDGFKTIPEECISFEE